MRRTCRQAALAACNQGLIADIPLEHLCSSLRVDEAPVCRDQISHLKHRIRPPFRKIADGAAVSALRCFRCGRDSIC